MRLLVVALACFVAVGVTAGGSLAQSRARIFDVELGSPVSALPSDEWVDPSCGTNGGPPSLILERFEEFARCPVEDATGLHEVWFIYDDEWEYIARAYRDPSEIRSYSENVFFAQPVITSLMIDEDGIVQGYRMITDPRAPVDVRGQAYALHGILMTVFRDAPWHCTDLPVEERERPVDGIFLKTDCEMMSEQLYIKIEGRLMRKPGQDLLDVPPEGYFESSTRLEVYSIDAVTDSPCCLAS